MVDRTGPLHAIPKMPEIPQFTTSRAEPAARDRYAGPAPSSPAKKQSGPQKPSAFQIDTGVTEFPSIVNVTHAEFPKPLFSMLAGPDNPQATQSLLNTGLQF